MWQSRGCPDMMDIRWGRQGRALWREWGLRLEILVGRDTARANWKGEMSQAPRKVELKGALKSIQSTPFILQNKWPAVDHRAPQQLSSCCILCSSFQYTTLPCLHCRGLMGQGSNHPHSFLPLWPRYSSPGVLDPWLIHLACPIHFLSYNSSINLP